MTVETKYLYGSDKRIFLNTNLGCSSKCRYCYLPKVNLSIGSQVEQKIPVDELIKLLESFDDFKSGLYLPSMAKGQALAKSDRL